MDWILSKDRKYYYAKHNSSIRADLNGNVYGGGVDLDGTDDYIDLGDPNNTSLDTQDWSIVALISTDVLNANEGIYVQRDPPSANGHAFLLRTTGTAGSSYIGVSAFESTWALSTGTITDSGWHWIGATSNTNGTTSTTVRFFIDGAYDSQDTTEEMDWLPAASKARIGSQITTSSFSSFFDGKIALVAKWNVVLTDNQVITIMQSKVKGMPYQIQPANLVGYWPLDDLPDGGNLASATFVDRSGNGNNGTGNDANASGGQGKAESVLSYPEDVIYIHDAAAAVVGTTGIMTPRTSYWGDL